MKRDYEAVKDLQKKIGYQFENEKYLERALIHSSYANEHNMRTSGKRISHNEMMEFLGDSVLGFVITEYLYSNLSNETEGSLTRKRAAIVCERSLALSAKKLELGKMLKLGRSVDRSKDRDKPSILSDAMEAIFAAVYLDGGLHQAKKVILLCMREMIEQSIVNAMATDYKTSLQEQLHNDRITGIEYRVVGESGPDHDKVFVSQVLADSRILGTGSGSSKKESEQQAAKQALETINRRKKVLRSESIV